VTEGTSTRFATRVTCAAAVLIPLAFLPPLQAPFTIPKGSLLEIAAALAFAAWTMAAARYARPVMAGALAVLATGAISTVASELSGPLGAPYAVASLARWGALFGISCGVAVVALDAEARRKLLEAVTAAAAIVSAIGLIQHVYPAAVTMPVISAPGGTFGNRNMAGEAVAMSLPLGIGALLGARGRQKRTSIALSLCIALVYLAVTRTRGAWLGGVAGAVTVMVLARPRLSRRALAVGGVAATLALLGAILPGRLIPRDLGDSKRAASGLEVAEWSFDPRSTAVRTRLGLWQRSLRMWRDYPVLGAGPGNWPVLFPRYAEPGASHDGVLTSALAPRQAHDDFLERLSETGVLGFGAFVVLVAGTAIATRRRLATGDADTRVAAAGAAGSLVALLVEGLTGFPLDMPATVMLSGVAIGLVAGERPPAEAAPPSSRSGQRLTRALGVAVAAALILGATTRAERQFRASYWLWRAERELYADDGPEAAARAMPLLERAAPIAASTSAYASFLVPLRIAQTAMRLGNARQAADAARAALRIEPYSPNAWATLSAAELRAGQTSEACTAGAQALLLLRDYPLAWLAIMGADDTLGDTQGAASARTKIEQLTKTSPDEATRQAAETLLRDPDLGRAAGYP
jgi:O-antigen ligase